MFKKIIKYLFYLFLAYLFLGFFILPFILKPQLVKIIQNETKTEASIESLSFNPLIFTLEIKGLQLRDLQKKNLFSFKSLLVNLNPSSLLYGALELKELSLYSPKVYVVYNKDKSVNLLNVLKEQKELKKESVKKEKTTRLPRIIVDKVKLEGGRVFYKDYTRKTPFSFSLENIGFTLENFDTKNITKNSAGVRLYSQLGDGGFVDFKSKILSVAPFKIEGSLGFEASKLYTEWKYMQDVLKLEVADGKVSFYTKYAFNLDDINATKIEGLNLSLEKLRIKPKAKDKDILNLESLYVKNATLLPMQQKVRIEKIGLYGLGVKAVRDEKGMLDWLEYIKMQNNEDTNTTKQADANKSATAKPWDVRLHSLALEKIGLLFRDKAVHPNVTTKLNELDIYAKDVTLAGEKPFAYQIQATFNDKASCDINGTLAHKQLSLVSHLACRDIDIVHYRPYIDQAANAQLKKFDLALNRAFLDFQAAVKVDENTTAAVLVDDANVSLRDLLVRKKSTHKKLVTWKDFNVQGIEFSSAEKKLFISNVALDNLLASLVLQNDGTLNVADIVVPKRSSKAKKAAKKSKKTDAYSVKVGQIALNGAKVTLLDKSLMQAQKQTLDRINIKVNDFDIQKRTWLYYNASMRLNQSGILRARGKLRHTPLKQSGEISAKKIALTALTPYLKEKSFISIDDGRLSFKLKEHYLPSKRYPDLRMHGEVMLNSFFVTDTKDANSSLFSLNELHVHPFTLELFPNRLYVDAVDVDSFYVAAKIDENKTLNFSQLMKQKNDLENNESNTSQTRESEPQKSDPFPVKIAKVNVKNGSAEFRDFSLPIKFKTNIHNLNGALYAVSSSPGDTSYIDIDGDIDKYGSTKLRGSVDSFNPKEYTDLKFDFKNLDLHAMSGYSASFAGYEIDSGKLYLDLGYNILHSKLNATNSIMIKKIKLGKELEGDDVNHLPLGFVIGLLEDSDGIIDIDMPIEGNVDEPDFKYGTLVWKTLGNLIAKAVTSPFKFLGSMMGMDGEDLEFVAFEFGKSDITPPQREKLDKIAKLMRKRPKISLKVDAVYDEAEDLKALKLQKLVAMVMKKSGDENIKNNKTALNIDVLESVYADLREDDALAAMKEKLHKEYDNEKAFDRAYQNALIELCTQIQPVGEKELERLAKERVQKIQSYLVTEKSLAMNRVLAGNVIKEHSSDDKIVELKLNIIVQSSDK